MVGVYLQLCPLYHSYVDSTLPLISFLHRQYEVSEVSENIN